MSANEPKPDITPSPWRTLARAAASLLIFALVAVGVWFAWNAYAAHHMKAALAQLRARYPVAPPPQADLVNGEAFTLLAAARASLSLTPAEEAFFTGEYAPHLPFSPADMQLVQTLTQRESRMVELIAQAAGAPAIFSPPDVNSSVALIRPLRLLAMVRRASALYFHQSQRDDLLREPLRDLRTCSAAATQASTLARALAASLETQRCNLLLDLAPDLAIQSPATPHGMPREQVAGLIRDLLDQQWPAAGLRDAIANEAAQDCKNADTCLPMFRILQPLLWLDGARSVANDLRLLEKLAPAPPGTAPLYPELHAAIFRYHDGNVFPISAQAGYTRERVIRWHCQLLDMQRGAAIRLALRLYQIDHQNQLPETLEALAPAYLPGLPTDLFSPQGHGFIYNRTRRLFYSVGINGSDEGGAPVTAVGVYWDNDAVFYIDRQPYPYP